MLGINQLTLNDQAFPNWWNKFVKEKSRKSWLPSANLSISYLDKSVEKMDNESWFTAESYSSTKLKSKHYRPTALLKEKHGSKKQPNSLRKIRLLPNQAQKAKLNQVFHGNRYAYNLLVEKSKDKLFSSNVNSLKKELRPLVQKKAMNFPYSIRNIPEEALDSAFRDLFKARKTTLALSKAQKTKSGKGFSCKLDFKRRKANSQSIEIRARSIKQTTPREIKFWSRYFKFTKNKIGIKIKGKLPPLKYSWRLQRTRSGKFYLCIPEYKEFPKTTSVKSCGIDPGVRTMLTGYDPDGYVFEFGSNLDQIMRRAVRVDRRISKLRNFKGKRNRRYRLSKSILNIRDKVKNMISDCHHKISKWLSVTYHKVLLPKFETQQMSQRISRKINSKTVRKMMTWSHYKFKELLRYKLDRTGGKLIDCTEEYTSKTCTNCGRLNHSLGSSKVFHCSFCNITIDRDINGARNIYLKNCKAVLNSN